MKYINNWNQLPLSENLNLIIYVGKKNGETYSYGLALNNNIKINKGYYYFVDKYTKYYKDYEDIYSDYKLFDRISMKFLVAIYNMDTSYILL